VVLQDANQGGVSRSRQHNRPLRRPRAQPFFEMQLPSVVSLKEYVPARGIRHYPVQRLSARRFTCSIAANRIPHDLTFDHLVPRSRAGRTIWSKSSPPAPPASLKGNRLPGGANASTARPVQPTTHMLQENAELSAQLPPWSWRDYLYWEPNSTRIELRARQWCGRRDANRPGFPEQILSPDG